jgi:predicted nucleic acid-binding protein
MAGIRTIGDSHAIVGIDTSVFIYQFEGEPRFAAPAEVVLNGLASGLFDGVTSALTVMELLVRPLQIGRVDVADDYQTLLANYPNLTVLAIDQFSARMAARLRAAYRLAPADALQVATCLRHGATAFVTNDHRLRRIKELEVILLDELISL